MVSEGSMCSFLLRTPPRSWKFSQESSLMLDKGAIVVDLVVLLSLDPISSLGQLDAVCSPVLTLL